MSSRGTGALGRALLDAWGGEGKSTYHAKGWHAQISKLTEGPRGYDAMQAAGISISADTLLKWLTQDLRPGEFAPTKANQSKIREAYERLAGRYWDPANETREYRIHGEIDSGDRTETRTLKIRGSAGIWDEIRTKYQSGELDEDTAEELFVEHVIVEDIGDTTGEWGFPGGSYTV